VCSGSAAITTAGWAAGIKCGEVSAIRPVTPSPSRRQRGTTSGLERSEREKRRIAAPLCQVCTSTARSQDDLWSGTDLSVQGGLRQVQLRRLFVRLKNADACSPCISRASPQPEPTTACKLAWQSLQGQNFIATVLQPAHAAAPRNTNNPTPSKPSQSVCINPLAIHYPRIAQHPTFLCAHLSPTRVAQLNLAHPSSSTPPSRRVTSRSRAPYHHHS